MNYIIIFCYLAVICSAFQIKHLSTGKNIEIKINKNNLHKAVKTIGNIKYGNYYYLLFQTNKCLKNILYSEFNYFNKKDNNITDVGLIEPGFSIELSKNEYYNILNKNKTVSIYITPQITLFPLLKKDLFSEESYANYKDLSFDGHKYLYDTINNELKQLSFIESHIDIFEELVKNISKLPNYLNFIKKKLVICLGDKLIKLDQIKINLQWHNKFEKNKYFAKPNFKIDQYSLQLNCHFPNI
jgi:hypothetical protein